MSEALKQIMDLISQLSPEEMAQLIKELETVSGEQETAEPEGTVSPEGGPAGVPVKM